MRQQEGENMPQDQVFPPANVIELFLSFPDRCEVVNKEDSKKKKIETTSKTL